MGQNSTCGKMHPVMFGQRLLMVEPRFFNLKRSQSSSSANSCQPAKDYGTMVLIIGTPIKVPLILAKPHNTYKIPNRGSDSLFMLPIYPYGAPSPPCSRNPHNERCTRLPTAETTKNAQLSRKTRCECTCVFHFAMCLNAQYFSNILW